MRRSMVSCGLLVAALFLAMPAFGSPVLHFAGAHGLPVDVATYSYALPANPAYAVELKFGEADAARLRALFRANDGEQVTARIGGQTVLTPVVREVPAGDELQLTVADQPTYDAVKAALAGAEPTVKVHPTPQ